MTWYYRWVTVRFLRKMHVSVIKEMVPEKPAPHYAAPATANQKGATAIIANAKGVQTKMVSNLHNSTLESVKGEDFMHRKRKVINYGSLTAFEDILIKNIAMHFALHGLPITAVCFCIVFQKVYICQTLEVEFPIFQQTQDNIRRLSIVIY